MKKNVLTINNTLSAVYPDGFCEMSSVELKKFFMSDASRCGVHDKDRHMILNICWTKPGILGFLTDERSILNGAETRLSHHLQGYRRIDRLSREIMGYPAIGIRFEYKVTDTDIIQHSDLYVVKVGKVYYAVQSIGRKENPAQDQQLTEDFIDSMSALV